LGPKTFYTDSPAKDRIMGGLSLCGRGMSREFPMSYAEIYRHRNAPWRKLLRRVIFCVVVGLLLYFAIELLYSQSGLMMGGAGAK
jgi:hypothetical protein